MTWITEHFADLAGIVALVVIVGERIAAVTATPEDDKWFSWIHKVLAGVGLKFPDQPK